MRPNSSHSAKSGQTKITIDSDFNSKDLTGSKFSQTFSVGVQRPNDDFKQYVQEKNRDPKFKQYLKPNLPEIPQKTKKPSELSKLTSKPFQKRPSKIDKQKTDKKIQEPPRKQVKEVKSQINPKQESVVNKSIKKFNGLKPGVKKQIKQEKSKISFNGFILNVPGKGKQVIEESPPKKTQKMEEQKKSQTEEEKREKNLNELSNFISDMETRNLEYYPREYDEFISKSRCSEIEKVNIEDFMSEPNERDYENVWKAIDENDKKIEENENLGQSSVNLDEIISESGTKNPDQFEESVALSYMSSSEIRDRNMFVTEIMKGKITLQQIKNVQENDKVKAKMIKLEEIDKTQKKQLEEDEVEIIEVQLPKKKVNKIVERNKVEASGKIYRQCDYMTEEEKQRIEDLLNGVQIQSPFDLSEMDVLRNRRISQGIQLYREFSKNLDGQMQQEEVIPESSLPKDPLLKKEAEMKMLKEKIGSVNGRLRAINQVVVNKAKIRNLVEKYKQITKVSKLGNSLILEKQKQLEEQDQKLREAEEFLVRAQGQKEEINQTLEEMEQRFKTLQQDLKRLRQMDAEELYQYELQELNQKRQQVQNVENQTENFNEQIQAYDRFREELQGHIRVLEELEQFSLSNMNYENYQENETIEDLDKLITSRWEEAEKACKNVDDLTDN